MKYEKLNEIKDIQYNIVSLGHNCLPRTILTRWGIKPSKEKGENSMPFDLATYETFEITKQIKENFKNIFENLEYKKHDYQSGKNNYWTKKPDLIEFIHEKNLNEKDKQKLIEIYTNRIINFRKCVEDDTPILFVQLIGDCDDTENLFTELKKLRKDKPFLFVVIDPFNLTKDNPNIHTLRLKYPSPNYQYLWWSLPYYSSKDGKKFEKDIVDFCIEKIKLLKNL